MNKRPGTRLFALATALWMAVTLLLPVWAAPSGTVTVSSPADLLALSKNCALDAWSQGRTVVLTADLDLSETEFTPIPTFGGTFLGQGHTISGLSLTGPGSNQGLFRYVQPGAVIQDLTVQGVVAPDGTRSTVGGIAGVNAGTLSGCSFHGRVLGEDAVGGIAGRNEASGQITGCVVYGSVGGRSATGGVAGRNSGLLLNCINHAGVNLDRTESDPGLLGEDAGAALGELASASDETYHLLSGCTDTGGIVGWTGGVVQSCVNSGSVGYPHVGYNTGGIAGRQSGYLAGCVNNSTIHGRKDVGGIVGQAEPYLVASPGQDTLNRLQRELDTLDRLISRALDDVQYTGDDISRRLENMGGFTGDARDSSQRLLDRVADFTDETVDTVNLLAADITLALDKISPALDDLSKAGGRLEQLSRRLEDALDSLDGALDTGGQVAGGLRAAARELRRAQAGLDAAADTLRHALDTLYRGVFPEEGGGPVMPSQEVLEEARAGLGRAYEEFSGAKDNLLGALSGLRRALESAGPLPGQLRDVLEELQRASGSAGSIGWLLERAFDEIGAGVDVLTRGGPTQFTPLGEEARQASDSLFSALSGLSDEMEGLNGALQEGNHLLTEDLRAINRQFSVIFNLMLDAADSLREGVENRGEGIIQDTSDEDISATREGKVAECRNTGAVEGDRNVGGIAGAVAVEVDLDPEDDISGKLSFGTTYETKAVLQGCVDLGSVTAKKDCAGGLAGRMDLGTALDCQSCGRVTSTGGDYVGGVVGYADANLIHCWAKSTLSGGNYVGGIAGWASRLRDCRAITTIEAGTEYLGAVAGWAEKDGLLSGNCFLDTGWAGVDGVSYAGRAEPVSYDVLSQLPGVPREFTAFTLTLTAQGETVAQIPFLYGDDLSRLQLPQVPEREGCYGLWPEFDVSGLSSDLTVEAVYAPWITLTASQERAGKLSLALAEGQFTRQAALRVTDSAQTPPPEAGNGAVVWDISLTGTELSGDASVPLRLLAPDGGTVWQRLDGRWQQAQAVQNGQYLLLTMAGTQGTFCLRPARSAPWPLAAAVGGAAVLAAAVWLFLRRRGRKKAAKTPPKETAGKS